MSGTRTPIIAAFPAQTTASLGMTRQAVASIGIAQKTAHGSGIGINRGGRVGDDTECRHTAAKIAAAATAVPSVSAWADQ